MFPQRDLPSAAAQLTLDKLEITKTMMPDDLLVYIHHLETS